MSCAPGLPDVDVIIPVRLPAAHLKQCIESLQQQSHAATHIIVVAHGDEAAVRLMISDEDPSITVISAPPELTLSEVRNLGVRHSSSELVAMLDSDDVAEPNRLEAQASILAQNPKAVLCTSSVTLIDEYGQKLGSLHVYPDGFDFRHNLILRNRCAQSAVMLRREAFDDIGGYRDVPLAEDYDLWMRLAASGAIVYTSLPLVRYRCHPKQLTSGRTVPRRSWGPLLQDRLALAHALGKSRAAAFTMHAAWVLSQLRIRARGRIR